MKYHVVGGFSFYERAEIKDMISYLKLLQNPDDSIALQRVINTPPRGIGKNTMEVLERLALETGISLWGAIQRALDDRLLQPRALAAVEGFVKLIEDARAMLRGSFVERLTEETKTTEDMGEGGENFDFNFGAIAGSEKQGTESEQPGEGFRTPGSAASLPELLKFLID